ncbi:MAG TPA: carboxypeptidase-like regulatory domain-containing protein [Thermoanaerobaculia bacterium]|nr:carboxypeptidase-like regulatory domain-containing protein [Thermoanaerobaculia bacterium]
MCARSVRLFFGGFLVFAVSAIAQQPVTVTFEARGGGNAALPPRLELRLTDVSDRSISRTVPLIDGRGELDVPAGKEWDVRSGDNAFVIAATRMTASAGAAVTLEVWPAAKLRGRVAAQGDQKPAAVSVTVAELAGQGSVVPRGTKFDCDVDRARVVTCSVPAAARHLVLRMSDMVPHYLWELALTQGGKRELGTISFRRGASFTAYLDRGIAQRLEASARARLLHPVPAVPSETTARLSVPVAEGSFDKRGFVQLAGVPAGTYILEIRAKGFATRSIGPLEIYDGKETSFRKAIELFPPVQVGITVDPPHDLDDRPWRIRWERVGDFAPADAGITLHAGTDGRAVIADQSPGLFSLQLFDTDGNPLWGKDVRVDEQDVAIPIALDLHLVKGNVSIGEIPLEATLWFGTANGAVHARAASDAEGRFAVRLPHLSEWPVEVVSRARSIHSIVNVDVDDDDDVAIELPDTSLSGRVVDADGQRLSRGRVTAQVSGRALSTELSSAGEFSLRGVPEGTVHLIASNAQNESSSPVAVPLSRNAPVRDVELRILETHRFAGTVVSAGQPVVGAHVSVVPLAPRGGHVVEAVTDAAGKFQAAVLDRAVRVLLVIAAPSRTLQTFDVPVTAEEMRYDVAPRGGTLGIHLSGNAQAPFTLTRDGVEVPLASLLSWILAHGAPIEDESLLRVMDLAPGHYRVCGPPGKCTDGALAPGATLELHVPADRQ